MLDLSNKKTIIGSDHWFAEVNQLYHPTGKYSSDSTNIVYSKDLFGTYKFDQILLKEWFFLLKKGGYLIVDYKIKKNSKIERERIEKLMWWLWKGKYEVLFNGSLHKSDLQKNHAKELTKYIEQCAYKSYDEQNELDPNSNTEYSRFICKKLNQTISLGDEIDKWTFGIVTDGRRVDSVNLAVETIRKQHIPNCQIIICGLHDYKKTKDVLYLPFTRRSRTGWITRKKNLIVQNSLYENICVMHDRMFLDKHWFKGMLKWGNCFEHLTCRQTFQGTRSNDWIARETFPYSVLTFASLMDYRDWDLSVYASGQLHIAKKTLLARNLWDETLYWNQSEDVDISNRLSNSGSILRCNPYSSMHTVLNRFGTLPELPYNRLYKPSNRKGDISKNIKEKLQRKLNTWINR